MKYMKVLWILMSIFVIWWIFYFFILPYISKKDTIVVPDVTESTLADAQHVLTEKRIKYNIQFIDGDEDKVVKTYPASGVKIYSDYEITLYVEKYKEKHFDFIGINYNDYENEINNYCEEKGYELIVNYLVLENSIANTIISQSLEGNTLSINVAINDDYFYMPKLVGLNINDAIKLLFDYQLRFSIVYFESPIINDTVIYQSIKENTIIKKTNQSPFEIYVSSGIVYKNPFE